ncbi:MAG: acetate/propionate family kinase [Burkholderiaceae bacterium]|nr:acetate/propionate family kinase [Burkholderiaceae bacterium]MEB2353336.1 acetate/propionate family kinase [Burkholderiaceae bacterium]
MTILVLNSGSSSFKFAVYARVEGPPGASGALREQLRGQVHGLPDSPVMTWRADGRQGGEIVLPAPADQRRALREVLAHLREQGRIDRVEAVGHRVVHGGETLVAPCRVDATSLRLMESLEPLAPLHQSHCVAGIHAMATIDASLPQVACFDTAYHATQPRLHTTMPLPVSWRDRGVRRYGFHGLSFESIAQQLPGLLGALADARIVVAHLGSGASVCAMRERRSVRTSMSLSTLDGLVMSTRPGAVDIGVALFAQRQLGMDLDTLSRGLYHQSGLLGLSGISGDMRVLAASDDPRARFAIEAFCQRAAQEIAASAVVLGGCDAIVFTAGIGENDAGVRAAISGLLGWMGARIDAGANAAQGPRLHAADSAIGLWVVPTDEEGVIARHTAALVCGHDRD